MRREIFSSFAMEMKKKAAKILASRRTERRIGSPILRKVTVTVMVLTESGNN